LRDGKAIEVKGFAVLSVDGKYRGYQINLLNGDARKFRGFPGSAQVVDVAMPLNQR